MSGSANHHLSSSIAVGRAISVQLHLQFREMRNRSFRETKVLRIYLNADATQAQVFSGSDARSRTHERIENHSSSERQ